MISPGTKAFPVSANSPLEARQYTREEAQEMLRALMTEKFRRWLVGIAMKWTHHNWHWSQELVQDVFLSLLKCQSYDPSKSSPTSYALWRLRGIYSQSVSKAVRKRMMPLNTEPVYEPGTPLAEIEEVVNGVREAIQRLPNREATILQRRLEGKLIKDIASELGVSKQRVNFVELQAIKMLVDQPLPV